MVKRLSPTGIEYGDYGYNFYPGCQHGPDVCPVSPHCWAKGMSKRFGGEFSKPHLKPELLLSPLSIRKPSTILVNFMGDLGGEWVDPTALVTDKKGRPLQACGFGVLGTATLKETVVGVLKRCPQHRFLFLTKTPSAWQKWDVWPDNAFVGATAWDAESFYDAAEALSKVEATHKWVSFEPLLDRINGGECDGQRLDGLKGAGISWVVIGGQQRPDVMPEIAWVREIVEAADRAGIKVWLKNNLYDLLAGNLDSPKRNGLMYEGFWERGQPNAKLRQERPE